MPIRHAHGQFTRFENFSDDQGLGNASVSALAQDADGTVMIGTEAGLYRYDGAAIAPYGSDIGLPSGAWIRRIMIDPAGHMLVVTSDNVFIRYGSRFTRVETGGGSSPKLPRLIGLSGMDILLDRDGVPLRAHIGPQSTGPFLPLLDPAAQAIVPELASARFITPDSDGSLLIGCGTALCRVADNRVTVIGTEDGLPADTWQVAARAPDGMLWVRSLHRLAWRRGRSSFNVVTLSSERDHAYERVPGLLQLLPDGHGGILTQGEDGVLDWNGSTWRRYTHHEGGLAATPIESLMLDREGSLWAGSLGHGVFRSLGLGTWEHWTADDGLGTDLVWNMTRLRDNQFWVATYDATVRLDGKSPPVPGGSSSVQATHGGRLWTTPLDEALVRLDPANGQIDRIPFATHVISAFIDPANRLWLCSLKGLYMVADADAIGSALHVERVLSAPTFQVIADDTGTLWTIARDGLYRSDAAGRFRRVTSSILPDGEGGGLALAPDNQLWVSTESVGLLRFRIVADTLEKLPAIGPPVIGSSDILFLHRDRRGWMWVGTDHGLDLFDGRSWRRFDKVDGILSNDMDQSAVYEDADGSMWFGTSHGLTHLIDPSRLQANATLHPAITDISMGKRNISQARSIRVGWSSAALVVRFVDLDFAKGPISFRYRLNGVDTEWTETTGHDVRYASLGAGDFRFELVSVDTVHGVVSDPVGFMLHVSAPWWRRWWFYGLLLLLGATLLAVTWLARVRLLLRQQRRLEGMVGARTAEIEQARRELQRLALSDALTGLANRRAVMGILEEAVAVASRARSPLAVLLCDIDHFKKINDGFGHLGGDAVLTAFGTRLGAVMWPEETAGRYGGEEFLIVLPGMSSEEAMRRVGTIRTAIAEETYSFGSNQLTVTSSGGVAFLRPGDTAITLVARADMALYRAKANGRNRIETEATASAMPDDGASGARVDAHDVSQEALTLERDLRAALGSNQFTLHYQPVVDMVRDVVTSCEALLRWTSPTRGAVSPAVFVPQAEAFGLMPEIGDWVLRTACREALSWPRRMKVAVNLSPKQLQLPDLPTRIAGILDETGLPASRLELEVTETAMIEDMEAAIVTLERLRALGITIALDDFGTGYSSLSFVSRLPFNRIKIDRSFVQDLGVKPEATAIVAAIAGLCVSLDASLTAEGVETEEQINLLRAMGGGAELQGFGIARPCPAAELHAWLAAFEARTSRRARLREVMTVGAD